MYRFEMSPRFGALLVVAGLLFAGCGSATPLDEGDSGGGTADSGPRADGASIDSGATGDSGGATGDSGSTTDVDSGGTTDTDSGTTTDVDAGATDVDGGVVGVACGAATCGSGEICCVTRGSGGMMVSQACTAPGDCMGAALTCDGPEDCATGEACCGSFGGTGGGGATCVTDAMCRFGRLCHVDSECTGTDTCCAVMGVNVCSPFCRP
jgi:hypothetical protein